MTETLTAAQLQKETAKLAKLTAAAKGYPKHSPKRHRIKERKLKVEGRVHQIENFLRKHPPAGPDQAVAWAKAQVGTTEQPPYSNLGPKISEWERHTGYAVPPGVFWCGCFASEAVVVHGKAKIPNRNRCGYGPYVMADARAHRNGFVEVAFFNIRKGDYLVFFNGEHQGIAAADVKPGDTTVKTLEGNTSPSSSGSQFNGGCVAAKTRSRSDVSCAARPAYPK